MKEKEEFGQTCQYWDGKIEELVGRYWSRKLNGHSIIWDGGITRGMPCDQVPWYYRGGDKTIPVSTGLWTLGRNGVVKSVQAPTFWIDLLPVGVPTHGELWYDDNIEYLKTHTKTKSPNSLYWRPIKYVIFSVKPYSTFEGVRNLISDIDQNYFYPNREQILLLDRAKEVVSTNRIVSFVEMSMINSKQQALELIEDFNKGIFGQWEGLMFLKPNHRYEGKRSYGILKYKPSFEDECTVTGYEEGKTGDRIGKVGTILAKYTITEKCRSVCGFRQEFVGRTVPIRVSGLNQAEQDWEDVESIYPKGSELRFGFKMFSEHGQPQSANIYRGM